MTLETLLVGGFITLTVKHFCDWVVGTDAASVIRIRMFPPSIGTLKNVHDKNYVVITEFCETIHCALGDGWSGGLKLIGAPQGAGKSTIVLKEAKRFIEERCFCQNAVVVIKSLGVNCIHDALRIRPQDEVSDFVAERTIIIIHQADLRVANMEALSNYIVSIATDSYNSDKFCILMCMSTPETFRQVLTYNGGQKISMLCQPSELKWDANKLEMLINSSFPEWSKEGKRELLEITLPAMSPGVIVHLLNDIRIHKMRGVNDFCNLDLVRRSDLLSNVERIAGDWAKFEIRNSM
jgi:hypothetical protein